MWFHLMPTCCLLCFLPAAVSLAIETSSSVATTTTKAASTAAPVSEEKQKVSDQQKMSHVSHYRITFPPNLISNRRRRETAEVPDEYSDYIGVSKRLPVIKRPSHFRAREDDEEQLPETRFFGELFAANGRNDAEESEEEGESDDRRMAEFLRSVISRAQGDDGELGNIEDLEPVDEESMFSERNEKMKRDMIDDDAFERALAAVQSQYAEADERDKRNTILRHNTGYPLNFYSQSPAAMRKRKRYPAPLPLFNPHQKRLRTSEEMDDDDLISYVLGNIQPDSWNENAAEFERKRKREADPWFPALDKKELLDEEEEPMNFVANPDDFEAVENGDTESDETIDYTAEDGAGVKKRRKRFNIVQRQPHKRFPRRTGVKAVRGELKSIFAEPEQLGTKKIKKREGGLVDQEAHNTPSPTVSNNSTTTTSPFSATKDKAIEAKTTAKPKSLGKSVVSSAQTRLTRRKKSWDEYWGVDKRKKKKKRSSEKNDEAKTEEEDDEKFREWAMRNYYKDVAMALTSKKKRSSEPEKPKSDSPAAADKNKESPLKEIDQKIEAIENLILHEALEMVEQDEKTDADSHREHILNRLDAAQILEKIRQSLDEFQESLRRIRQDQEQLRMEEEDKKKRGNRTALQEMKEQPSSAGSREEFECPVVEKATVYCKKIVYSIGDKEGALAGACVTNILCRACSSSFSKSARSDCGNSYRLRAEMDCESDVICRALAGSLYSALNSDVVLNISDMCVKDPCLQQFLKH